MTIILRDPTGEATSSFRSRVPPLKSFQGKTLALFDIGKMRGDEFIDKLETLCADFNINTHRYIKPTNTRVAPKAIIQDITANCDAVIIALSDCGSCTSCSTHDLNALDKNGLCGVSVLTEEFQNAFDAQKSAIGFDAASVYVPHPMQNKTRAELHSFAQRYFSAILGKICTEEIPNLHEQAR